jgi:membrane fusion protein, multidrug efflux system
MPAHCDVAPPLAYGRAELEPTSASEMEVARAGECVTGLVGMRNANLIREMTTDKVMARLRKTWAVRCCETLSTKRERRWRRLRSAAQSAHNVAVSLGWVKSKAIFWCSVPLLAAVALALASCNKKPEAKAPEARPVRTVVATPSESGETVVLTGHVAAETEASLGFRVGGRVIERLVNVGDHVETGQDLAKLDPQDEVNALRSAQAALAAAQARLTQARDAFERQRQLLTSGHTPRSVFDQAQKELQTAQANVDDVDARLTNQALRVSWTILQADAPGTVSAAEAEPGEVVQPGQMIVRIARRNGRDAVFDVPGGLLREAPGNPDITVRLADDPSIVAMGRVREVATQADPATRTFEVKVGLTDPPPEMRLGSTVTGSLQLKSEPVMAIPASALTSLNGQPAVWLVDPQNLTVFLHTIQTAKFDPDTVVVEHGINTGDIVVTAGVHALHPGQKVRLLGAQT